MQVNYKYKDIYFAVMSLSNKLEAIVSDIKHVIDNNNYYYDMLVEDSIINCDVHNNDIGISILNSEKIFSRVEYENNNLTIFNIKDARFVRRFNKPEIAGTIVAKNLPVVSKTILDNPYVELNQTFGGKDVSVFYDHPEKLIVNITFVSDSEVSGKLKFTDLNRFQNFRYLVKCVKSFKGADQITLENSEIILLTELCNAYLDCEFFELFDREDEIVVDY